jgi:hypothetical protein
MDFRRETAEVTQAEVLEHLDALAAAIRFFAEHGDLDVDVLAADLNGATLLNDHLTDDRWQAELRGLADRFEKVLREADE